MWRGFPTFVFATTSNHSTSLEKKTTLYLERDEEKRQLYKLALEKRDPSKLVFIDETGMDTFLYRLFARAVRGEKVYTEISGNRYQRLSIIAGTCENRYIAPMYFDGYCNTNVVEAWLEQELLPVLTPGHIIVMDNASFHKSAKIKELIEEAGCELLFLPPYSPDLNPIEKHWAKLKQAITSLLRQGLNMEEALAVYFQNK
ncbi:MAG: IS630 family transposase [Vampirovibrionales bacterium]